MWVQPSRSAFVGRRFRLLCPLGTLLLLALDAFFLFALGGLFCDLGGGEHDRHQQFVGVVEVPPRAPGGRQPKWSPRRDWRCQRDGTRDVGDQSAAGSLTEPSPRCRLLLRNRLALEVDGDLGFDRLSKEDGDEVDMPISPFQGCRWIWRANKMLGSVDIEPQQDVGARLAAKAAFSSRAETATGVGSTSLP